MDRSVGRRSPGWRDFVGADDVGEPAAAAAEPAPGPFVAVGREAFLAAVAVYDGDRQMRTKLAVLLAVAGFANEAGGESFPSRETIAREAGVSEATAKRTLRWASATGWLAEVRRIGRGVPAWQLCAPGLDGADVRGRIAA